MKRLTWVWAGTLLLTVGAVGTASCGSSDESNRSREGGGSSGEGSGASSPGGVPGSGGSGAPVGTAGRGGEELTSSGAGGTFAGGEGGTPPSVPGGSGGAIEAGAANSAEGGAGGADGTAPALRLVYNTGVDDSGVALAGGSVDPHYTLIQSPDATYMGPDAIVTTQIAAGYWLAQDDQAASKWIAPTPNQSYPGADPCNASGIYVWRTTFDLTGLDPETFVLHGGWATDNYGTEVMLNGVDTGITTPGYSALAPFTLDSGFIAGINTLDFEVTDIGCPNGLRVELSADTGAGGAGGAGSL